jgi:hypothetical protein
MSQELKYANDQSVIGFGSHSASKVEELQKALAITQNYGTTAPNALTGGSALAVEDLDKTLKLVTNTLGHLKLWKDIIKENQAQVVSEYNVQNSYGQEVSPFFNMGGLPQSTDANYDREIVQVKYLGTQGQVQHNLTLIQAAHGPVIAREVKNKTIELLSRNERYMFEADSNINTLEYDGIRSQIEVKEAQAQYKSTAFAGYESGEDSVIIDVKGQFTDVIAEKMALTNVNNFGMAMDCYLASDVHSRFSTDFFNKQRVQAGEVLTSGNRIKEHQGIIDFRFKPSLFNRPRISPLNVTVSATAAPTLANPTSPVDALSKFAAADAGAYGYKVSMVYADGETLPSTAATVTVAAGDSATVEISFTGNPIYANVFRTALGDAAGVVKFTKRISVGASAAAVAIDLNDKVPGSSEAFLLMHDADTLVWRQLGSLIKYDLAVIDTSYRWAQLMYGTPLISAARKHIVAKNITA